MDREKNAFFLSLLEQGVTQYHTVAKAKEILLQAGYEELDMLRDWEITPGKNYFVSPYSSCLFAFSVGKHPESIRIAGCHTDFPMLKLKTQPEMNKKGYMTANVEPYGGLILNTWFDRPLGLAGKLVIKGGNVFQPNTVLYDSERPLFVIPNLAPHLKKEPKGDVDIAKEIVPLFTMKGNDSKQNQLLRFIAEDARTKGIGQITAPEDIIASDLYLYCIEPPVFAGLEEEFLVSPRIDNLSSAAAIIEAMTNERPGKAADKKKEASAAAINDKTLTAAAFFDNEEIGSRSKQGADSVLMQQLLQRVISGLSLDKEAEIRLQNQIFMISLDVAHALHPNYPEKGDTTNDVLLGNGIVLKSSASQRYVSDSEASAVVSALCRKYNIKMQLQVNRSGMAGGQTLGPIISSYIPALAADLGIPVLAMHSACETAHRNDYRELVKFVKAFFTET